MYLTDKDYPTATLQKMVVEPPVSKVAIEAFISIYKVSKDFLDKAVFSKIRNRIESAIGSSLNLRSTLDKATFGRFIIWGELSHRQALPSGWQHLNLLMEDEPPVDKLVIPFEEYQEQPPTKPEPEPEPEPQPIPQEETIATVREERDQANDRANRYHQMLKEYEEFTRLLLVGRIFPAPLTTNGLEETPLLQVFAGARSLQEVHQAYRELRKLWHPDISPFSPKETNDRFDWLKKAYTTLVDNWSRFDPQNMAIPVDRIKKLKAQQLKWEAHSFWYENQGLQ